jgi:hypothetical protein
MVADVSVEHFDSIIRVGKIKAALSPQRWQISNTYILSHKPEGKNINCLNNTIY